MTENSSILWLLAIPLIASPIIYLVGRICVRRSEEGDCRAAIPARWLALAAMLFTWVPLIQSWQEVLVNGKVRHFIGGVPVSVDGISLFLAATALLLGTVVVIYSMPYMAGVPGEEKYYALLPMMVGTIIGLGITNDLFNLWVWFEAMAISSYLLVAFYTNQPGALEAGVKYLVQSAVGSVLILMGIALVFSQAQTLRLDSIAVWGATANRITLASGALFIIGFGVKTALVPLHTWLPDAHSQAPSGISAMLSGIVIEAGLIAMLRVLGCMPGSMNIFGFLLLGFGALNMLFGNLMALRQHEVKRLLAYSSLSQVGYMLLGFGVAALFQTPDAAAGGFFHLFTHAMMKGLAFLAAGILLYTLYLAHGTEGTLTVEDLNGASKRYPLAAFGFSIALLALGGLPPLAGFMSKWQVFAGGVETHNLAVILLIVFAALNSVLSLGYYAPLVNRMYRLKPSRAVMEGEPMPRLMAFPVVLLVLVVVVIGFWPSLAQVITNPAANSLLAMFGKPAIIVSMPLLFP